MARESARPRLFGLQPLLEHGPSLTLSIRRKTLDGHFGRDGLSISINGDGALVADADGGGV